jgi:hypothetical protein
MKLNLIYVSDAHNTRCRDRRSRTAQDTPTVGTLIVPHGGSDAWNAPVLRIAEGVRTGGPVEVAFLMGPAAARFRALVGGRLRRVDGEPAPHCGFGHVADGIP